jgi:hypothetical protein
MLAHDGDGIDKSWQGFAIPCRLSDRQRVPLHQLAGHQRHDREQAQEGRSGTGNRLGMPLPLGFQTHMSTCLLPRHLQAPAEDKPLQDLDRVCHQVCAQQGFGGQTPLAGRARAPSGWVEGASQSETTPRWPT